MTRDRPTRKTSSNLMALAFRLAFMHESDMSRSMSVTRHTTPDTSLSKSAYTDEHSRRDKVQFYIASSSRSGVWIRRETLFSGLGLQGSLTRESYNAKRFCFAIHFLGPFSSMPIENQWSSKASRAFVLWILIHQKPGLNVPIF